LINRFIIILIFRRAKINAYAASCPSIPALLERHKVAIILLQGLLSDQSRDHDVISVEPIFEESFSHKT